jgi:hypothetical protein
MFPVLQVLSLREPTFQGIEEEATDAIDFSQPRSLTLRFCWGWEAFLLHGISSSLPTNLKILEIQSGNEDQDSPAATMAQFLSAGDSIEQLFLSHKWVESTPEIWNATRHQKSSLKVFVYHRRKIQSHL